MIPKEKARELVVTFIQTNGNSFYAKDCALIAVNEILNVFDTLNNGLIDYNSKIEYWQEVKQEIEKL